MATTVRVHAAWRVERLEERLEELDTREEVVLDAAPCTIVLRSILVLCFPGARFAWAAPSASLPTWLRDLATSSILFLFGLRLFLRDIVAASMIEHVAAHLDIGRDHLPFPNIITVDLRGDKMPHQLSRTTLVTKTKTWENEDVEIVLALDEFDEHSLPTDMSESKKRTPFFYYSFLLRV